jgi:hypothetical protein
VPSGEQPAAAGVAALEHATAHEGEPSDWLEIEDAEPSVIGEAPDSVAIVPPVDLRRAADEELLQSAEHEEIELTSAADDATVPDAATADPATASSYGPDGERPGGFTLESVGEPGADPDAARAFDHARFAEVGEAVGTFEEATAADLAPADIVARDAVWTTLPPPHLEPRFSPAGAPSAAGLAASFAATMPPRAAPPASVPPDPRWAPVAEPMHDAGVPPDGEPAGLAHSVPLGPDEQAHWDSVAEEIRMQVLQRIDLFTDTGLREQLGERLKPIVDRASADLVATINQHVGELLRAYVAEAIEREIERWRRDN